MNQRFAEGTRTQPQSVSKAVYFQNPRALIGAKATWITRSSSIRCHRWGSKFAGN